MKKPTSRNTGSQPNTSTSRNDPKNPSKPFSKNALSRSKKLLSWCSHKSNGVEMTPMTMAKSSHAFAAWIAFRIMNPSLSVGFTIQNCKTFHNLEFLLNQKPGFTFGRVLLYSIYQSFLKERYSLLFSKIKSITPSELKQLLPNKPVILDVREVDEYQAGHIPAAKNVPLSGLPGNIAQASAPQPWYLICRSGRRSLRAARILRKAGYQVINVSGGMLSWQGPVTR